MSIEMLNFDVDLPKVTLMGLRKSGKSSIRRVVFDKVQPQETTFQPTTTQVETQEVNTNTFVQFQVMDFPGQTDPFDPNNSAYYDPKKIFENLGAIVFVMECDRLLEESQKRLLDTITACHTYGSSAFIHVFIHKIDELIPEKKNDLLRSVKRYIDDSLASRLGKNTNVMERRLEYNLTTIYDHSVFEAFSHVVQNLIRRQGPRLNELTTMLKNHTNMESAFLLDRNSRIYLSINDSAMPEDYEIMSEAVDLLEDLSSVYSSSSVSLSSTGAASELNNSHIVVRLSEGQQRFILYVRQLGPSLVLACIIDETNFVNRSLIDFNISVYGKAVAEIFAAGNMK